MDYHLNCIDYIDACSPIMLPFNVSQNLSHYLQILLAYDILTHGRSVSRFVYSTLLLTTLCVHIEKDLHESYANLFYDEHTHSFSLVDRNAGRDYVLNVQFACHSHHSHNGRTSDIIQLQPL